MASTSQSDEHESESGSENELELDLTLDENGRITCPASDALSFEFAVYADIFHHIRSANDRLYTRRFSELCKDCRTLFTAGRSFFIRSDAIPQLSLEKLALNIFHSHVGDSVFYDRRQSWAEYWVQVRTHKPRDKDNDEDKQEKKGGKRRRVEDGGIDNEAQAAAMGLSESVAFHYDKDESLTDQTNVNIYPHLSKPSLFLLSSLPLYYCYYDWSY